MKEFQSEAIKKKITSCIIEDNTGEIYWCVYHPDDAGSKLVFSSSVDDLENLEDFSKYELIDIHQHLNQYGFDLEKSKDDYFGDVECFESLPSHLSIKMVEVEISSSLKAKFKF